MVVVVNKQASDEKLASLVSFLEDQNLTVHTVRGKYQTILGLIGDTSAVDIDTDRRSRHRRLCKAHQRALQEREQKVPSG